MFNLQKGIARSGLIILLLIVAAVVVLFLLPTPKPGQVAVAATGTKATEDANCLSVPANFSMPAVLAADPPASLWKGWSYGNAITLSATPSAALVDQPVTIRVSGLKPNEPVTLRANMQDYQHRTWRAAATFLADNSGKVDVTRDAPKYGSYSGEHAVGLVWSMLPENVKDPQETLYDPSLEDQSYPLTIEALAGNRVLAQTTLTRYLRTPGVTKTLVTADSLTGVLYIPSTP
ncbi:MAG: acyl-CoA thioesterase/BAAT N-terminal domain-containing protein, partial [Gammaproteobacteria bacterium]|nr:acyl-CoA thioesterase/BAAT N-terminal domain-containing protein [Gammaproteobacteria bacterium]